MRCGVAVGGLTLGLGLAVAGCANLATLNGFTTSSAGPRATPCTVAIQDAGRPRDMFTDTRQVRMTTGDRGWCGWAVRLVDNQGVEHSWTGASVARAPVHGEVRIRRSDGIVHIEYRPAPGYRGADAFAVRLAPGFALRQAKVNVVASAPGPVAPEPMMTSTRQITEPRIFPR